MNAAAKKAQNVKHRYFTHSSTAELGKKYCSKGDAKVQCHQSSIKPNVKFGCYDPDLDF